MANCFKANSAILNSLLTIINEHLFSNGNQLIKVPLMTMFAASNELPEDMKVLGALFDRFVLRYDVQYIKRPSLFRQMVTAGNIAPKVRWTIPPKSKIPTHEVQVFDADGKRVLQKALEENEKGEMVEVFNEVFRVEPDVAGFNIERLSQVQDWIQKNIQVTDATVNALVEMRNEFRTKKFAISDRRWKKSIALAKSAAFLFGDTETSPEDLLLLRDSLWEVPDKQGEVSNIVSEHAMPLAQKVREDLDKAKASLDTVFLEEQDLFIKRAEADAKLPEGTRQRLIADKWAQFAATLTLKNDEIIGRQKNLNEIIRTGMGSRGNLMVDDSVAEMTGYHEQLQRLQSHYIGLHGLLPGMNLSLKSYTG